MLMFGQMAFCIILQYIPYYSDYLKTVCIVNKQIGGIQDLVRQQ